MRWLRGWDLEHVHFAAASYRLVRLSTPWGLLELHLIAHETDVKAVREFERTEPTGSWH